MGDRENQPTYPPRPASQRITNPSEVTDSIVETVAERENAAPAQLPPLGDALDEATRRRLDAVGELSEPLEFEYLWYDVTVFPDGEVVVTP